MQLGVDGVFVGSGIFKSSCPEKRARAMVQAVTHFSDASLLASVSEDLGEAMVRGGRGRWVGLGLVCLGASFVGGACVSFKHGFLTGIFAWDSDIYGYPCIMTLVG